MESKTNFGTLYKATVENSNNGIFLTNSNFELTYANSTCIDLLGYSNEENIHGENICNLFFSANKFEKIKRELTDTGEWQGIIVVGRQGDIQIILSLESITVNGNEDLAWKGTFIKVSDYQVNHVAQQESHVYNLLESSPDAILIVNEEGKIELCNSQVEKMMGFQKSELVGEPVEKLIPEAKRAKHEHHRAQYKENPYKRSMGSGLDLYAQRKDGSKLPVDIMLGPLEINDQLNTIAIVRDVSDFKESQNKLKKEKAFISLVQSITKLANQAQNAEKTFEQSIRKICEFMSWPIGHVYLPAKDGSQEFYPSDIWYLSDEKKFAPFNKMTMCTRFAPGIGMVGDVMLTGEPQWYKNVHEDSRFVRRMPETDLNVRACLGVPVLIEDRVLAVLEFFTSDVISHDEKLIDMMTTIGKQLGQAIDRIEANRKLDKSKTKFKTLFDTALDAIFIFQKYELVDCNERAIHLLQRSVNTLRNTSIYSFLPEKQPDGRISKTVVKQKIARAYLGENQFFELQFERPGGTSFYAEVSLVRMILDGKIYIQATLRDVTERKKSERELKKNMHLFSQLFENSPGSVVLLDKTKKVININESFQDTFGYNLSEVKDKELTDFFVPDGYEAQAWKNFKKTLKGNSVRFETNRIRKDGTVIPVVVDTAPVKIDGETKAVFKIYVDVSEQKRIEDELLNSLDEKEILLREIHHRVKNNLAVVSGLLGLQITHTEDKKTIEKLRESQSRIHSMGLVHEQLYKVDSFSAINLEKYIRELTKSIESTFDNGANDITVNFQTQSASTLELKLDQAIPCGQLLNELLTNAYKHAFQDHQEGEITISLSENNGSITLEVSDNGCGIPDDMLNEETASLELTLVNNSLGLTLINNLVKQLEGKLYIYNQDGTTFVITFPKAEQK